MSTEPPQDTLRAALAWHAAGASVVRVATDGTKRPLGSWAAHQKERATEQQLRTWFTGSHPGLGIVCGAVSGGLEMLEFEGRAVAEGVLKEFGEIAENSGLGDIWKRVAAGYLERSPSGGIHVLYRLDGQPVPGNTKLARRPARGDELTEDERQVLVGKPDKVFVRDLVETRGEGGFVVVAPSAGPVHETGLPYQLLAGTPDTLAVVTAEEREALHSVARTLDTLPAAAFPAPTDLAQEAFFCAAAPAADGSLKPGEDFEQRTDWADILTPHGWRLLGQRGRTRYWQRPGKNGLGISATTGHADDRDRLYVFSSSTEFDPERPYTKFAAHALLEHRGDYSGAAKDLRRRGYGTAPERHLAAVPARRDSPAAPPPVDGTAALKVDHAEETGAQQKLVAQPAQIDISHEPDAIIAITDAIRAGAIPDAYVRNGGLVQVAEVSGDCLAEQPLSLRYAIHGVGPDSLRRLLARHADVYRLKAGKKDEPPTEVPSSPAVATCKAILTETSWPGVAPLVNVIGAPVLRPDGSVLQEEGYDAATALFYAPHSDLSHVPDHPTSQEVSAALQFVLEDVLGDFPWASDADRANYLALLVSPILRTYIGGLMPLGAISAADRGSGKTLLADIIGTLYGATVRPWVSDDDELRKAITAALMTSNSIITLDNVGERDCVEAPTLAKLLTSPAWDDRVLGRSEQARLVNDRLWLVTGNNIRFGGDIAQRTVLVHLDPQCPRPDLRTGFRIPDLDEWLEDATNRSHLLHSLLLLARAWIAGGAPRGEYAMRNFRRWARSLGGFLAFHGVEGFLSNASQLEQQDEEASAWASFLSFWHARYRDTPKTAGELRASAQSLTGFDDPWNGTFITKADGTLPTPKGLGMMLASRRGRYFGDLVLRGDFDKKNKAWHYHVERDEAAAGATEGGE